MCVYSFAERFHRFIALSVHKSSLHHRVRGGNGQRCLKQTEQKSEQQRKGEKVRSSKQRKCGQQKAESGVEERNTKSQSKGAWETPVLPREVVFSSGYPPSPCLCFLHPCDFLHGPLAPWPLCRLPFLSPTLSLCSRLTCSPHRRVECRQRSLNLTPLL